MDERLQVTPSRKPPTDAQWHNTMQKLLANLPIGQREDFEERAGIMEFDGGLTRRQAEKRAWRIVIQGVGGE